MMHSTPDRRQATVTNNQRGTSGNAAPTVDAFIGLGGITNVVHIQAINDLYNDLVNQNLWSKIDVLYPFVGGTAAAHVLNLKDPTQYTLTFTGSVIHDANGVTGTSSQNANFFTAFNMSLLSNPNDFSFGLYGRAPSGGATGALGNYGFATDNFTSPSTYLLFRADGGLTSTLRLAGTTTSVGLGNSSNARFMAVSSESTTTAFTFANQFTVTTTIGKGSNLGATQIGGQLSNTSVANAMSYSIWYVGKAMTETELVTLNAIFQKFNDTLDTSFSSTRGTNYYINPAYDRIVNRYVSNIQVPAIGTFTTLELDALNYLVTALQNSTTGLWGNLTGIYPLIGNTLAARLRELKSLGASTATSSGTFNFTPTTGLDPTALASFMTLVNNFSWNTAVTYGFYISEDIQSSGVEIAHTGANRFLIFVRNTSNQAGVNIGAITGGPTLATNANAIGSYILSSTGGTAGTTHQLYKNGSLLLSGNNGTSNTSGTIGVFGGNISASSQRTHSIVYHLNNANFSAAQIAEMNTIVVNYVTILNRQ